jgi:hypothetical protein
VVVGGAIGDTEMQIDGETDGHADADSDGA